AQALELLRLQEPPLERQAGVLGLLALGHVDRQADDAGNAAAAVGDRRQPALEGRVAERARPGHRLAREGAVEELRGREGPRQGVPDLLAAVLAGLEAEAGEAPPAGEGD